MQNEMHKELSAFLASRALPQRMLPMMQRFYLPLAERLKRLQRSVCGPVLLGINGAQGSGKSTMASALAMTCRHIFRWRLVTLSMDDLYLGRA